MNKAIAIFQMRDSWRVQWMQGIQSCARDFDHFEDASRFVEGDLLA